MKRKFRILKNSEYQTMTKSCKFIRDKHFVVYYKDKLEDHARAGISISKKIGIAVIRNKIKRQIKSFLQQNIDFSSFSKDFIIYPRQQYKINDYQKMNYYLLNILKKLGE